MAARAPILRVSAPLARARCPIVCKPVLDRNATLRRHTIVRAEAEPSPVTEAESDSLDAELEVDKVQQQRALKEDQRQAQRSSGGYQGRGGQRGGRDQKDEWEDKIIQVRDQPHSTTCTWQLTCSSSENGRSAGATNQHPLSLILFGFVTSSTAIALRRCNVHASIPSSPVALSGGAIFNRGAQVTFISYILLLLGGSHVYWSCCAVSFTLFNARIFE